MFKPQLIKTPLIKTQLIRIQFHPQSKLPHIAATIFTLCSLLVFPCPAQAADPKTPPAAAAAPVDFGYRCEADIFYVWRRLPPKKETAAATAAAAKQFEPTEPVEIYYTRIGERAAVEKTARERLELRLPAEQGAAMNDCLKQHENQSGCIAESVRRLEATYKTADYTARKVIMQGIKEDCENSFGRCLSTKNGTISCGEDRPPEVSPPAAPEAPATPATAAAAPAAKEEPKAKKK